MKKLLFLFAVLLTSVGAWAQVSYTISANTGSGVSTDGWSNTWTANSNPATLKLLCTAGNMQAESDGLLSMYVGKSSPSTYTLQVSGSYRIVSYSFKFTKDGEYSENVTLKVNGQDYTPTNEKQTVTVNNVNATSTTFQMAGANKGIVVSDFNVVVERVFESGYYTIQCNGNNKFANYNGGERIVPMDMGRFKTSVYILTKGENGMYTIQTSDKKYVTYTGTDGDALAIVDAASANDDNKWWVINQSGETEIFTIVPKQNNIGANTPGWNYSVDFGSANGAVGFYDRSDGNSKWLVKPAAIMTTGTAKISCHGSYVTLADAATLFTKGNASNACLFTILAGEEGKYTIQLSDGRYVTHNSSDNGDQIAIVEAASATDENKWWVIAPNVTGEKSTGNEVDILPARGTIGRGTDAWNWSVNSNANLGFWGASDGGSRCTIEWTPTTFTYRYSYNGQVKHTEQAQGFVGYPYPAPTLSVFGVVPLPLAGEIVAEDQGKTFDMEYTVDLPFQFADSYDKIEHWYFMKIRDDGFTYMGYDAEKSYIRANQSNVPVASKDAYTWGFVGNPFDGFSIVNYATGKTKVLSAPVAPNGNKNEGQLARMVEVTNEYTGNLVWNFLAPTHANPKPGVFYIKHPTTDYAFNRQSYDGGNVVCYWTGRDTGSAVQVEESGVFDLGQLENQGIYVLQAERSPLMYSTTAGKTTKLSSGLVDGVSANANDINQQFIIFSSKTDGLYYLYSVGASKFVDADLNFVDYPEPVLSFEAYDGTNSALYPWWVKINGKYVIPGDGGTDGNKLHHTAAGDDDAGKRYRIIKVDEDISIAISVALTIQYAEGILKDASSLSNSKVYTVSTHDRGVWSYNAEKDALWYAASVNPETKTEQFAFLTVGGRTYLYSVGAGKFVKMSGADGAGRTYTAYSDVPSQPVEILKATGNKFFPLVVALKDGSQEHHIGISSTYNPPVITFYNDLGDDGNKVGIREAGDLENSAEILATMDAYLAAQTLVPELNALITRAGKALTYLLEADKEALATAKTNAENVLAGVYDSEMLGTQITALTTALNAAILVDDYAKFKNNYVYSFVTSRGWVGADANSDNLIGTVNPKVTPAPTPSDDNTMFQWAVYKSSNNHYYMYNIGKGKFMGVQSANEQPIPFADAPQSLKTTFKNISGGVEYPIMLSPDNVGAVSQNGTAGLFYWNGGWNRTDDAGSNHRVTVVGAITESTLATIAEAVELYEEICELGDALADADNRLDAALGYYSCTAQTQTELDDIEEFMATATDVAEVNAKTARVNELIATFTLNVPQAGKFYRLKGISGNYIDATSIYNNANATSGQMSMKAEANANLAGTIFYLDENKYFLNYATGTYVRQTSEIGAVGATKGVWSFAASSRTLGKLELSCTTSNNAGENLHDNGGTRADRCSSVCGNRHDWTVEEVTELPLAIHSSGKSTYSAPVDVEVPEGVTAYYAKEQVGGSHIRMYPITIIPANEGVVIKGTGSATVKFPIIANADALPAKNLLKAHLNTEAVTPEDGNSVFIMATKNGETGFYPLSTTNNVIGGHKSYLEIPSTSAARLSIIWDDTETGIFETEGGELNTEIYDLTGRRLDKPTKGVNVVGGKLVIK